MKDPFSPEDLDEIEQEMEALACAFRLKDYDISVAVTDDEIDDFDTFAEIQMKDHWSATIVLHQKFFDGDRREQTLTLVHELFHLLHARIDNFVDGLAHDDDRIKHAYSSLLEDFIESAERAVGSLIPE